MDNIDQIYRSVNYFGLDSDERSSHVIMSFQGSLCSKHAIIYVVIKRVCDTILPFTPTILMPNTRKSSYCLLPIVPKISFGMSY